MTFKFEKHFNPSRMRHYINGETYVVHCQFFFTGILKLVEELNMLGASKLMSDAARDTFYNIFFKHFKSSDIVTKEEKIDYIESYYYNLGLGILKININENFAILKISYIDESWLNKYKRKPDININFMTAGFLCATFSIINNKDKNYYFAQEQKIIVNDKELSKFNIKVHQDEH